MPDRRRHRGPDPRDPPLFAAEAIPCLRTAVAEFSWLLSRGYAEPSALKLVGDRHALVDRQRLAVRRSSCADSSLERRTAHRVGPEDWRGEALLVDGFNLVTTLEAALGGAVVLIGRDGAARDLLGLHGTYRTVEETMPALSRVGDHLDGLGVGPVHWLLDRPISNSGRLKALIEESARLRGWDWTVELVADPDPILAASEKLIVSADAAILERCERWANLSRLVIETSIPTAWKVAMIDLA